MENYYIEKVNHENCFDPSSCNIENNLHCECNHPTDVPIINDRYAKDREEHIFRWKWIKNWEEMSFQERLSLFIPQVEYWHARDLSKAEEITDFINTKIFNAVFLNCRTIKEIKFDIDRIGGANIMIVQNPVDIDSIPFLDIKSTIRSWGQKFGFIK